MFPRHAIGSPDSACSSGFEPVRPPLYRAKATRPRRRLVMRAGGRRRSASRGGGSSLRDLRASGRTCLSAKLDESLYAVGMGSPRTLERYAWFGGVLYVVALLAEG